MIVRANMTRERSAATPNLVMLNVPKHWAAHSRLWRRLYIKDAVWEVKRTYPSHFAVREYGSTIQRFYKIPSDWVRPASPLELLAMESE